MPEVTKKPTVVEEDLDDDFLDGALDGFTSAKPATAVKPTATTKATSVTDQAEEDETESGQLDDEFKNSLAAGMEELMKEMNGNSELQKSFEEMFKGLGVDGKAPAGAPSTAAAAGAGAGAPGESFQDRIAKTMGKLKESSDEVDAKVAEDSEEALMAEMMKQMEGMAEGGDFQNVLEGMMEQLMSKDILYEPMFDLQQKYPQWLKDNKDKISESEYARYEKQYGYVNEIVEFFDKPDFDDKSEAQSKSIIDLMQGMQDCGQPPADILDELAPGLEMGADGTPKMPDMPECNMQ
ncbi:Peroxisome chaperone and import receptor [Mortierella antarctica]|nr:Peroxisome chaperone and import receptor [Mortierella antarctica]